MPGVGMGAVKSRSAATLQLGDLILTAPSEPREQLACAKTLKGKAGLCRQLRPDHGRLQDPLNAAKLALRSLSRRIALLDEEIAELDARLPPLVASAAPKTTELPGISTGHAGRLLLTAGPPGHPDRGCVVPPTGLGFPPGSQPPTPLSRHGAER
jgi:transposase